MKRAARAGSGLLLSLLLTIGAADAQSGAAAAVAAVDVSEHCVRPLAQPAPQLRTAAVDFEALLYNDPSKALAWACAGLSGQRPALQAGLNIARALRAAARPDAASQVLSQLEAMPDLSPLDLAQVEVAKVEVAHENGKYATAQVHVDRAFAQLDKLSAPPPGLMVRALIERASVARGLNQPRGLRVAADALDAAEKILHSTGMAVSYPMTSLLNQRTVLAYANDDWPGAIRFAVLERDMVRRLGGPNAPAQIDALVTLGNLTATQRKYDEALQHLSEARRIGRLAPQASRQAYLSSLSGLSPVLLELGRPLEALETANEGVALAVQLWGAGSPLTLTPLEKRAAAEEHLQRYVQVRRTYEELLAIVQKEGTQIVFARRLRILDLAAGFYLRMKDVDAAQRLVDQMLSQTPDGGGPTYWRGRGLRRAAMVASAQAQWLRADALYEQARLLLLPTNGEKSVYIVSTDVLRCALQLRGGLEPRSCASVATRMENLHNATPSELMRAHHALAQHAAAQQQPALAYEHLLQALAASQSANSDALLWQALGDMAVHQRAHGPRELAVVLAKKAVESIEDVRRQFWVAPEFHTGFFSDRLALYRQLADWLVHDQRVDEALQVLRLLKGEEYRGFVEGRLNAEPVSKAALMWTAAEQRWLDQSPLGHRAAARGSAVLSTAALREQERVRAKAWGQAMSAPLLSNTRPPAAMWSSAPPVAGVLEATVFLGDKHINFVLRSARDQQLVRVPADREALVRDIGRLLARLEKRDDVLPLLRSLFDRVAAPLDSQARRIGATRLALRLDGDLRYLPYAALHDGGSYLVERYTIEQQLVSAAARPHGTPATAWVNAWVNAFGSTREVPGLAALPGVMAELCGIVGGKIDAGTQPVDCPAWAGRAAVPGRGWLNDAFTRQNLRQAAASGQAARLDLLHIGTHFVLQPGEIGRSWMQLGDGQRLYLNDMLNWRFSSQELVTLSACETGVGGGGEVEGLATLMLNLGAQAVIASLWRVEDRSTAVLMRDLYAGMRTTRDPAVALRQAQLQALATAGAATASGRAHPFHWASFYLTSRGR